MHSFMISHLAIFVKLADSFLETQKYILSW